MSQEEFEIVNRETKKDQAIKFLKNNKKLIVIFLLVIILIPLGFVSFNALKLNEKKKISNQFNLARINFSMENSSITISEMKEVILEKDKTYSPLALYFLIDNNLLVSKEEINNYFDIIINEVNLDKNNRYLNIYKKGLFNSDSASEDELLSIINPVIKEENDWKSHALYLMAEYYFYNKQFEKSKEFYNKIITYENSNKEIKLDSKIRIQRDFSD